MTGYQTGADNRLTNDGTYTYQYDKEGNRTRRTKTATGEVTEYEWDYRNRLVKVTDKNSQGTTTQVVEYTYDVFDRRIAKEVDASSPFDMADAAIERYVHDDIHTSLASLDGGNVVLDFADPDGSGAQAMAHEGDENALGLGYMARYVITLGRRKGEPYIFCGKAGVLGKEHAVRPVCPREGTYGCHLIAPERYLPRQPRA